MIFGGMYFSFRMEYPDNKFDSVESLLESCEDPSQLFFIQIERSKNHNQTELHHKFMTLYDKQNQH